MSFRLKGIEPLGADSYEVFLDTIQGDAERVVCQVLEHSGVTLVTMEPDMVMPRWAGDPPRVDSREMVTAVLEYHRRRHEDIAPA